MKKTLQYLRVKKKFFKIPGFLVTCGYKFVGYKFGKNYEKLPEKWVMKFTTNREYWLKKNIRNATSSIDPYSGYGISSKERENRINKKK